MLALGYDGNFVFHEDQFVLRLVGPFEPRSVWVARALLEAGALVIVGAFLRGRAWAALATAALAVVVATFTNVVFAFPEPSYSCTGEWIHPLRGDGAILVAACLAVAVAPWSRGLVTRLRSDAA